MSLPKKKIVYFFIIVFDCVKKSTVGKDMMNSPVSLELESAAWTAAIVVRQKPPP